VSFLFVKVVRRLVVAAMVAFAILLQPGTVSAASLTLTGS
jgi:hypothetical protein